MALLEPVKTPRVDVEQGVPAEEPTRGKIQWHGIILSLCWLVHLVLCGVAIALFITDLSNVIRVFNDSKDLVPLELLAIM